MACVECACVRAVLERFPAGDPRASLKASEAARKASEETGQRAHVHYVPGRDEFTVVIGDSR